MYFFWWFVKLPPSLQLFNGLSCKCQTYYETLGLETSVFCRETSRGWILEFRITKGSIGRALSIARGYAMVKKIIYETFENKNAVIEKSESRRIKSNVIWIAVWSNIAFATLPLRSHLREFLLRKTSLSQIQRYKILALWNLNGIMKIQSKGNWFSIIVTSLILNTKTPSPTQTPLHTTSTAILRTARPISCFKGDYHLTAQNGSFVAPCRLSRLFCTTLCLSSEERLSSSSDESPSPYAANEAMADGFTAALSSVFGFFEIAAGCEKDGASRLPAIRINAHHNTTGKDKRNRENTGIR